MAGDDERFLERWSRRKHAARRGDAPPAAPEPPEDPAGGPADGR